MTEEEMEMMPLFSLGGEESEEQQLQEVYPEQLPLLALKNTLLFPGIVTPISLGREKSVQAVLKAHHGDKNIAVVSQRSDEVENPGEGDLYGIGVVAKILRLMKTPDGTTTVLLQGRRRIDLRKVIDLEAYLEAKISPREDQDAEDQDAYKAIMVSIKEVGERIIKLSAHLPDEAAQMLRGINNPHFLVHFVASNINIELEQKQELLELDLRMQKAERVLSYMHKELQVLEIKEQIEHKVRNDLEKQQRDYVLNQQLRTIQEELGENPQEQDVKELEKKAKSKKWGKVVAEKFEKELKKLRRMNPQVPEYTVMLNYLELLVELPWNEYTEDNFDLDEAENILNTDHYGLDKVKDRMLEYLAVLQLRKDMKAPILCLYGPPGVGKTSLGKSIAKALGREYVRMSLGGLHDEAELRGHRKTYIGAMPGRIVQSIKKAKSANPVFILDEIDKLGSGFRGDPSSALLEVLDPEQNTAFYDNYLETEFDLSKVLFIATANNLASIPGPLLDRMELIEVSGYSMEEKMQIAQRHLLPKQLEEHGLKPEHIELGDDVLQAAIENYTRESGVRSLERVVAGLMRYAARRIASRKEDPVHFEKEKLEDILGTSRNRQESYEPEHIPGLAVGLAWTAVGGDVLYIESSISKGKGGLVLTGNLGDVMKESAQTALSCLRQQGSRLGLQAQDFEDKRIHIHVPAGATPKDGPSAGITISTALASIFTGRPLRPYLAMTGESTLRGRVLPVGGIKEKLLAARRFGIKEVILCEENRRDLRDIRPEHLEGLQLHFVKQVWEVWELALQKV